MWTNYLVMGICVLMLMGFIHQIQIDTSENHRPLVAVLALIVFLLTMVLSMLGMPLGEVVKRF